MFKTTEVDNLTVLRLGLSNEVQTWPLPGNTVEGRLVSNLSLELLEGPWLQQPTPASTWRFPYACTSESNFSPFSQIPVLLV